MNDNNSQENNFWASYSDVFTTLAVIFLTLFLFALVKAGLSSMQTAVERKAHQNELDGKISKRQKQLHENQSQKMQESIEEIGEYEEILAKKMNEITQFAQKLQENKKLMKNVAKEQLKRDAIISNLSTELEDNRQDLKQAHIKTQELQGSLTQKEEQIFNIKQVQAKTAQQVLDLKVQKEQAQIEYQSSLERLNYELQETGKNNKDLTEELVQKRLRLKTLQDQLIDKEQSVISLKAEIKKMDQALASVGQDLLKTSKLAQELQQRNTSLEDYIGDREKEIAGLKIKSNHYDEREKALMAEIESLKKSKDLAGQRAARLQDENSKVKREIASITNGLDGIANGLRAKIAQGLEKKFKEAHLNVQVDPFTGNVTLMTGQRFLFKKNSAILSDEAKLTLKKIIPLYAKVLLSNQEISDKIASINIEGHASPSFRGRYVSPDDINAPAYSHNLNLSGRRAQSIANYIFGQEIKNYDYKIPLRSLTQAVGHGFIRPIRKKLKERAVASLTECGPYDCSKSQRVELSFTLKDDRESIQKILQLK